MHYPGDLLAHVEAFRELAARVDAKSPSAYVDAALALHVDVSVLRRRLQALSGWLDARLFDGRGRKLRVSADGRALLTRADRLLSEAHALRAAPVPSLSLGCTGSVSTELLPRALATVREAHPGLELRILRTGRDAALRALDSGALDMAIVRGESSPRGVASRRLIADRMFAAVPKRHPLASAPRIDADALAREPLVTFGRASFTRMRALDRLAPLGARVSVEVDGKGSALGFVEAGFGVALLSLVPGARVHGDVVLRDVSHLFAPTWFWLVWREDRQLRAWESTFVRALRARCARIVAERRPRPRAERR